MTLDRPPRVYAEWLPLVDRFAAGEDGVLPILQAGSLDWTHVVAERFTRRLADALATRLQRITTDLQRALDRTTGDVCAVSFALLGARRALIPLRAFATLTAAPDVVRTMLADEVTRFATRTQAAFEASAVRRRLEGGPLLKILRDTPLTAVVEPIGGGGDADGAAGGLPSRRGRRIVG